MAAGRIPRPSPPYISPHAENRWAERAERIEKQLDVDLEAHR